MYSALYQSLRALQSDAHVKSPNEIFDCEEFRYNHRFGAFQSFNTPPLYTYYDFKQKDDDLLAKFKSNKLYANSQEHFETARLTFDKYSECQTLSKIAKINFVVMRLLSSGLKQVQNVEMDFSENPHFPVIKMK
jgi:hypothetical protein